MTIERLKALGQIKYAGNSVDSVNKNRFPTTFYRLLTSFSIYLAAFSNLDRLADEVGMYQSNSKAETFDFIVVGAGSAGGVVASRLSEKYRVLLLEHGGEPNPLQSIPALALTMLNYPDVDWQFKTVPQLHSSFAANDRQSLWNQGKGLGGTSNINFMMQSRGNPKDFDNWASVIGDSEWNYENVLPFFKKSENFIGRYSRDDTHGKGGEITIERPPYSGSGSLYVKAGQELGYQQGDLNGNFTEGFDLVYSGIENGRRCGTYKSFIRPARKRNNLTIRKFSHVTKVLFRGESNEAHGMEYDRHGIKQYAYASKEVIISAGAVNSPKLLMLSGVGPKQHLESLGIPVKTHSPGVGQNLQDHTSTYLGPFFTNESITFLLDRDLNPKEVQDYFSFGSGVFSSAGPNAMGFISSSIAKSAGEGDWPDIQFMYFGQSVFEKFAEYFSHGFNLRRDVMESYYTHAVGKDSFMQTVSNGRPHARGEITLRNSNPFTPPNIDPKYLDNEHDIRVMVEGVKKAVEIAENTSVFQKVGTRFTPVVFPGCENVPFRSDAYWECYVRQYTVSLHHIVGTCSMGKEDSPNSVVDSKLRVIGTKKLRVIDASIMPVVPVGNTNAPTVMIAEKGADFIRKEWDALESTSADTSNTTENIEDISSTIADNENIKR